MPLKAWRFLRFFCLGGVCWRTKVGHRPTELREVPYFDCGNAHRMESMPSIEVVSLEFLGRAQPRAVKPKSYKHRAPHGTSWHHHALPSPPTRQHDWVEKLNQTRILCCSLLSWLQRVQMCAGSYFVWGAQVFSGRTALFPSTGLVDPWRSNMEPRRQESCSSGSF